MGAGDHEKKAQDILLQLEKDLSSPNPLSQQEEAQKLVAIPIALATAQVHAMLAVAREIRNLGEERVEYREERSF